MIAAWMAYALLVGALVGVAAVAAERACRAARRPARWVWATALGLTAGLTALAPLRPAPATGAWAQAARSSAGRSSADALATGYGWADALGPIAVALEAGVGALRAGLAAGVWGVTRASAAAVPAALD